MDNGRAGKDRRGGWTAPRGRRGPLRFAVEEGELRGSRVDTVLVWGLLDPPGVPGPRGPGGFAGLLLGSVSQQVVNHAPCPVVVVPGAP